jgi:3-dehydrosphinganine reductase
MVARDCGRIVIVSSAMALMGFTGYASYCPTKFALRGLADTLRNEVQSR